MKFLAAPRPHGGLTNRELPVAAPHCLTPKARNVACNRNKHLKVGSGLFSQPDCKCAEVVPGQDCSLPSQLGEGVLCLAQGIPALADISSTSDALEIVSEELVLGPSGLTSTDQSTQIEQVSHTLPSKALLKFAAASTALSMIGLILNLSCSDVNGQGFLQEGTSGRQSFNWHKQWYVSPSASPQQAKLCPYAEPA